MVARAEPGEVVPVYNLDVARDHTYFVGEHDYLVHDNTLPDAGSRPFDALSGPQPRKNWPAAIGPCDL